MNAYFLKLECNDMKENLQNRQSVTEAFLEHRSVLASYLAQKVMQQADIDDILQETFEQAYIAEGKQEIHSPKGFLFIVARRILSKKFKKQAKRIFVEIDESEVSAFSDKKVDPENDLHYKFKMDIVMEAIETLPPQCRRVFILRKIHGYSQKKIAAKLKISTSTVERHITIALVRMNAVMAKKGYSGKSSSKRLEKKGS